MLLHYLVMFRDDNHCSNMHFHYGLLFAHLLHVFAYFGRFIFLDISGEIL